MESDSNTAFELSVSIVLHHSDIDRLRCCVESLTCSAIEAIASGGLTAVRVSLVDNSCEERYRTAVETLLSDLPVSPSVSFELLVLPENLGFGHAHNRVMASVSSDLHLVLNPDTELAATALSEGLRAFEDGSVVLVSPRVSGPDGGQEYLCKQYPSVLVLFLRGFAPAFLKRWFDRRLSRYEMRDVCSKDELADITIASGCFMLLRVSALRSAGGFDDSFFLYFEDFDLSIRLRQWGRLVYAPDMQIRHYGGYAARKGFRHLRYFVASAARFFHRHGWQWI